MTSLPPLSNSPGKVKVLQRNRTNLVCMYLEREETVERERYRDMEIYFKELAEVIIEASKSKICRVGRQAEDPGKSRCCSLKPKTIWR